MVGGKVLRKLEKISHKKINHHKIISRCIHALDQCLRKDFYRELNSILLEELDIEYSSFFLNAHNSLNLYETNIRSQTIRQEIESIQEYKDLDGEDFQSAFKDEEIVFIEKGQALIYPTASHRNIRSAICLPLKGTGYWLLEDSRRVGEDAFIQELAKLSKVLEKLLKCHQKSYIDDRLNIYTARAVYEEYKDVSKTMCEISISNLHDLTKRYGNSVRIELLELVIEELERNADLRGAIGIENNDLLILYSLASKERISQAVEKIIKDIEKLKFTIEKETVQLNLAFKVTDT